ncbi:MAG: mechanosensitive ion channel family protein [Candidatus Acidiferrales bacterium]
MNRNSNLALARTISRLFFFLVLAGLFGVAHAQNPLIPSATPAAKPTETPAPDPLGRTTPRGTVIGFLQAAQSSHLQSAAQYFQQTRTRHPENQDELVTQLKALMDRAYVGNINRITDLPEGTPQEGLAPEQERVGKLEVNGDEAELILVRVNDPVYGPIWLFSTESLAKVRDLYDQIAVEKVETRLPETLVKNVVAGLPLWQWLSILFLIPLAMLGAWLLLQIVGGIGALIAAIQKRKVDYHFQGEVSGPLWMIIATALHMIAIRMIGLPLLSRHYYGQAAGMFLLIGLTWLLTRIVGWIAKRLRTRAVNAGHVGFGSLVLLGQRMLKALVVLTGVMAILSNFGFNMTTALAGLGIGGIAIAFAAQKTLENLFGGVSVLADEAIHVGDVCRFGNTTGTVEDIGLRSTRVRTLERIDLSIPNGALATMNLENLARRDKFLLNQTLGLRSETRRDQLLYVLAEIRKLLYSHPRIEAETARVRFIGIGESSLDVELFCYVKTTESSEFQALREDVLLRIMGIVESSGTSFSSPSRNVYVARDPGLDVKKSEDAERVVAEWREEKALPFPDFPPAAIAKMRGTVAYPPVDSALADEEVKRSDAAPHFRPE